MVYEKKYILICVVLEFLIISILNMAQFGLENTANQTRDDSNENKNENIVVGRR